MERWRRQDGNRHEGQGRSLCDEPDPAGLVLASLAVPGGHRGVGGHRRPRRQSGRAKRESASQTHGLHGPHGESA